MLSLFLYSYDFVIILSLSDSVHYLVFWLVAYVHYFILCINSCFICIISQLFDFEYWHYLVIILFGLLCWHYIVSIWFCPLSGHYLVTIRFTALSGHYLVMIWLFCDVVHYLIPFTIFHLLSLFNCLLFIVCHYLVIIGFCSLSGHYLVILLFTPFIGHCFCHVVVIVSFFFIWFIIVFYFHYLVIIIPFTDSVRYVVIIWSFVLSLFGNVSLSGIDLVIIWLGALSSH